jgi:hypothetical protein
VITRRRRERPARLAVAAAAVVALLLGCAPATPDPSTSPGSPVSAATDPSGSRATLPPSEGIGVSLGIYSGRPDPSWALTDVQAAEFRRLVEGLPTATVGPASGGLGYHGFTVTLEGSGAGPRTLVAFDGLVAEPGMGPRLAWLDPDGRVERFLLATGGPALAPEIVDAVTADIDARTGGTGAPSPSS